MYIEMHVLLYADDALVMHHNTSIFNAEIAKLMSAHNSPATTEWLDKCTAQELLSEMWLSGMHQYSVVKLGNISATTLMNVSKMLETHGAAESAAEDLFSDLVEVMVDSGEWHRPVVTHDDL